MSKYYENHILSAEGAGTKEEEMKIKADNLAVINAVKTANSLDGRERFRRNLRKVSTGFAA